MGNGIQEQLRWHLEESHNLPAVDKRLFARCIMQKTSYSTNYSLWHGLEDSQIICDATELSNNIYQFQFCYTRGNCATTHIIWEVT
jgi:hypothetical protein